MYKNLMFMPNQEPVCVMRVSDGAIIPFDPQNVDYQQYLAWLEAGNTVLPAEENE